MNARGWSTDSYSENINARSRREAWRSSQGAWNSSDGAASSPLAEGAVSGDAWSPGARPSLASATRLVTSRGIASRIAASERSDASLHGACDASACASAWSEEAWRHSASECTRIANASMTYGGASGLCRIGTSRPRTSEACGRTRSAKETPAAAHAASASGVHTVVTTGVYRAWTRRRYAANRASPDDAIAPGRSRRQGRGATRNSRPQFAAARENRGPAASTSSIRTRFLKKSHDASARRYRVAHR